MPRHSTFQLYSDTNTKVVSGYEGSKDSATSVKGSTSSKVVTEKVENVSGSCAGAV
jgi:hypothetical protein